MNHQKPSDDETRSLNQYPFANLLEEAPPITARRLARFIAGALGITAFLAILITLF